jgi:CBS domain-containing protein
VKSHLRTESLYENSETSYVEHRVENLTAPQLLFGFRQLGRRSKANSWKTSGISVATLDSEIALSDKAERNLPFHEKGELFMELRDIMTRNVEVVNGNASLKEAATKMKELDVGLIPVCDGDRLKGLLTDRDITIRATANGRDPSKTKVNEVMSTDIAYCLEDQAVDEAVILMEARQIRRLPILNQDKQLVGIVSLADIAVHVGDRDLTGETLEEISEPAEPKR